jgi:hypothetical protein
MLPSVPVIARRLRDAILLWDMGQGEKGSALVRRLSETLDAELTAPPKVKAKEKRCRPKSRRGPRT